MDGDLGLEEQVNYSIWMRSLCWVTRLYKAISTTKSENNASQQTDSQLWPGLGGEAERNTFSGAIVEWNQVIPRPVLHCSLKMQGPQLHYRPRANCLEWSTIAE